MSAEVWAMPTARAFMLRRSSRTPAPALKNVLHGSVMDTVFARHRGTTSSCGEKLTHFPHSGRCQFGSRVIFAGGMRPVKSTMGGILCFANPLKITGQIIRPAAVQMGNLRVEYGRRAVKGAANEAMHGVAHSPARRIKANRRVARRVQRLPQRLGSPPSERPHSTTIGHFIPTFISGNWAPIFHAKPYLSVVPRTSLRTQSLRLFAVPVSIAIAGEI